MTDKFCWIPFVKGSCKDGERVLIATRQGNWMDGEFRNDSEYGEVFALDEIYLNAKEVTHIMRIEMPVQ